MGPIEIARTSQLFAIRPRELYASGVTDVNAEPPGSLPGARFVTQSFGGGTTLSRVSL